MIDPNSLAAAFGVWAAVVGMIGLAIVWELSRLRREVRDMSKLLADHMIETEHRMTAVESHLFHRDRYVPPSKREGRSGR